MGAASSDKAALRILYVDDWLVAVDKPSGLLVHRGWDNDPVTALDLASEMVGARLLPVHRLDRATSGVLLFARDAATARHLNEQLAQGRAEKCYGALVRGHPPDAGDVEHPIPRREGGQRVPAQTSFSCVRRYTAERCAWVLAYPKTGRLHQVRRHLKHINHPILGDTTYGKAALNHHYRDGYGLTRLALCALSLRVQHPHGSGDGRDSITLEAPPAPELQAVLDALAAAEARASRGD